MISNIYVYLTFVPHQTNTIQLLPPALLDRLENRERSELLGILFCNLNAMQFRVGCCWSFQPLDDSFAFFGAAHVAMTPLVQWGIGQGQWSNDSSLCKNGLRVNRSLNCKCFCIINHFHLFNQALSLLFLRRLLVQWFSSLFFIQPPSIPVRLSWKCRPSWHVMTVCDVRDARVTSHFFEKCDANVTRKLPTKWNITVQRTYDLHTYMWN